jgi:hypothetical protein
MNLEFHLHVAGALQIALALMHIFFSKRFHWKEELARLSLLNRQIFIVHTIFICVVLMMIGGLSLFASNAILKPTLLSQLILGGFAALWALRLIVQWCVYDSSLWRGDTFRTFVHVAFTALWLYLTAVYTGLLLVQLQ